MNSRISRYITNMLLLIAGGFVIVATQAFSSSVAAWLAFSITGVGALALMAATPFMPNRGAVQRTLDAMVGVLATWTIIESLVFTGATVAWLSFGAAAGIAALALAGATVHELSTERVVHSLEVAVGTAERHEEYHG